MSHSPSIYFPFLPSFVFVLLIKVVIGDELRKDQVGSIPDERHVDQHDVHQESDAVPTTIKHLVIVVVIDNKWNYGFISDESTFLKPN